MRKLPKFLILLLMFSLVVPVVPAQGPAKAPAKKAAPAPPAPEPAPPPDAVDYDALYKIKEQGLRNSEVMEILSWLTDVHGARLTGSPQIKAAGDWAVGKLKEWGLQNARLEPWGPFGRGWINERFYMMVREPVPFPVIGYARAWTPGTSGQVTCDAEIVTINTEADIEKYKGKLKGKCILTRPPREVRASFTPLAERFTDQQLADMATQPIPTGPQPRPGQPPAQPQLTPQQQAQLAAFQLRPKINQLFVNEGIAVWLDFSNVGDGGTVFVSAGGSQNPQAPPAPPQAVLTVEHYGRIWRVLQKKVPVKMEVNIENKFYEQDLNGFNVIADLPGTDKADEWVMIGAHFDSWHTGTGTTDNGIGSAVMMEVMRILKASGVKLRRSVRIGLWGGEEQGLLGSRAYVRDVFAESTTDEPPKWNVKPPHAKFSAYYNIDNGTGKIRGVYLQGNESVRPIFQTWMEPFKDMGMTTLTIRNTGGTDHLAFDGVGLPGFQFIQDEVEYDTRTHHSNMDVYERAQEADVKQIATIVAAFVYHTANRQQLLPRKPMPPAPRPRGQGGGRPPMD
ncbi:MAG TPA: M20/M25/M40 family metallo-hydrolase [Candidatus Nitrosotenuis sp.]|nr:M20/M25/M40 family metallo-hydrolase [Candidatus Nitrosotenuis sp.]